MERVLYGGAAVSELDKETEKRVGALKEKGIVPCLAVLRVGKDPGALSYERGTVKCCHRVGVEIKQVVLPADTAQERLNETIGELNRDEKVHGVLILTPLPKTLDKKAACAALAVEKDVDGVTAGAMAKVYSGTGEGFAPCTAEAVLEMLRFYRIGLSGKKVAVLGRSLVVGRPTAMLLMQADATVTLCHSKTENMAELVQEADIVVVAIGKAESIGKEYFRPGQTVIDVGTNWSESRQKLVGDVKYDEAAPLVTAISPVPGGVGSITTSILASHVVRAAEASIE